MKYYLYSATLILFTIVLVITLPIILDFAENSLISLQIPQNNSQVAGIQKYNIPPISKKIPVPLFSARAVFSIAS